MKKIIFLMIILLPSLTSAHGGVEKTSGSVNVSLNQSPLSPYVNETVRMDFVFSNKNNLLEKYSNLSGTLTIIQTAFDDPQNDKIIHTQDFTTDANGSFDLEYKFDNAQYYDIDLSFLDPETKASSELGFLVQTREQTSNQKYLNYAVAIFGGFIIGCLLIIFRRVF